MSRAPAAAFPSVCAWIAPRSCPPNSGCIASTYGSGCEPPAMPRSAAACTGDADPESSLGPPAASGAIRRCTPVRTSSARALLRLASAGAAGPGRRSVRTWGGGAGGPLAPAPRLSTSVRLPAWGYAEAPLLRARSFLSSARSLAMIFNARSAGDSRHQAPRAFDSGSRKAHAFWRACVGETAKGVGEITRIHPRPVPHTHRRA